MDSKNQKVVIVDYGMGNLGSIQNMIKYLGYKAVVSQQEKDILSADKLILPGVGHFDRAMSNINALELKPILIEMALNRRVPFLGICLGMQLMCLISEEGTEPGLGLVDAQVRKFKFDPNIKLKVPHMGWNHIQAQKESNILKGLTNDSKFYFVHSYFVSCSQSSNVLTTTEYGNSFVSSFEVENLVGVQFHPEKSHKFGVQLFKNYLSSI